MGIDEWDAFESMNTFLLTCTFSSSCSSRAPPNGLVGPPPTPVSPPARHPLLHLPTAAPRAIPTSHRARACVGMVAARVRTRPAAPRSSTVLNESRAARRTGWCAGTLLPILTLAPLSRAACTRREPAVGPCPTHPASCLRACGGAATRSHRHASWCESC